MNTVLLESKEPNPSDLIWSERLKVDFDVNKMHEFLEGSKKNSIEMMKLMQQIERDPILNVNAEYYEMSKNEHRELTAQKIARLAKYIENDAPDFETFQNRLNMIAVVDPQLGTRIGVHLGLFLGALKGNGTEDQFNYWAIERGALYMRGIYGCFAMTEMAHGSNVAGLETTATFNKEKNTIIINTPHVGATKWWIGGAAHSATHTVCYARLISDGKDYGVKTFMVPLRDSNHELCPGVSIGDIGAKMGRDGIDNGWIQFSNVEIPKEYMLSKFTTIDEDGEVVDPPLAQLAYGALLGGRVTMVTDSFRTSERFITIALRYSVGRRQFASKGEKIENQLINYPLHQRRLIPYLSWTYGMAIASEEIQQFYKQILQELDDGVKSGDFDKLKVAIDNLKMLFGNSASLKSTCTWTALSLIDECRQSCGGHGYSSYSGFAKGFTDHAVQCTWEGDNNVLAQNSGRITIQKTIAYLKSNKAPKGDYSFISESSKKGEILNKSNIINLDKLLEAYDAILYRISLDCISSLEKNGNDWDAISSEKLALSKLYSVRYILSKWIAKMQTLQKDNGNIAKYLVKLAQVFAFSNIETFGSWFLQFGVISNDDFKSLKTEHDKLLLELRSQVIGLTDSFKFSNFFINSTLGSFNGDIYNDYLKVVKTQDKQFGGKAPYSEVLEKMLNRGSVEEREHGQKSEEVLEKLSN
ncbi:hypothetical protein CANARDRAFT_196125 [[Candida] arabinofermentans NRRL YB-2248]|uniref:Acyl-coenzyme A oxidase n=1 Tax=[Candida] arabinofermentans NRRL YB-2248 TaxID=983967 RepID=A0A1E4T4G8_9ASCO|nr:hypothetical protein CANARDRAFT_196125 [[Candida] arabinofermentans NRRL YB-2248]